jgi:hypothetical protein
MYLLTQPLTEMGTSKVWPVRKAHNFTAIFEPIVWTSGIQLFFFLFSLTTRCNFSSSLHPASCSFIIHIIQSVNYI